MLRRIPRGLLVALLVSLAVGGCRTAVGPPHPEKRVFYPLPPDPPRVQYLTTINAAWDVVAKRTGLAALVFGVSDVLERPYGIAVRQGKIYVCDFSGRSVKVFDLKNKRHYRLGGAAQIMAGPTNLCVDSQGFVFVVESLRQIIHVFDPQDRYLASSRVKDGRPGAVAAVGNELFVTDVVNDRVLVLDRSTGKRVRSFGKKGRGKGEFIMPNAIAADSEGRLYVSDQMNFRFQKLDRLGKPLASVGQEGDTVGSFARPRGITVGPDGVIYVVESVFEVVQMFNQEGKTLMAFGNFHGAPGFLELPAGIAVDKSCLPYFQDYIDPRFEAEYLVFVVSQVGRSKIGVYAAGRLKPGAAAPSIGTAPAAAPKKAEKE